MATINSSGVRSRSGAAFVISSLMTCSPPACEAHQVAVWDLRPGAGAPAAFQ